MLVENVKLYAGQYATAPMYYGEHSRYCVRAVHTRFDSVSWFVADGEDTDPETNQPRIIRQSATLAEAVDGLGPQIKRQSW